MVSATSGVPSVEVSIRSRARYSTGGGSSDGARGGGGVGLKGGRVSVSVLTFSIRSRARNATGGSSPERGVDVGSRVRLPAVDVAVSSATTTHSQARSSTRLLQTLHKPDQPGSSLRCGKREFFNPGRTSSEQNRHQSPRVIALHTPPSRSVLGTLADLSGGSRSCWRTTWSPRSGR